MSKGVAIRVRNETEDRLVDALAAGAGWSGMAGTDYSRVKYPAWTTFDADSDVVSQYEKAEDVKEYDKRVLKTTMTITQVRRLIPAPVNPIMVGEHTVAFHEEHIQVGCQRVPNDTIKQIVQRQFGVKL